MKIRYAIPALAAAAALALTGCTNSEGESASKGGYINRGFNDITWL